MKHMGDYDASSVIYGKFTTYRPSTGATFTLGGTPAISVYKDNSTTQSTSGVTLTADFDAVTGLNHFAIDTSADGTFYSAGSNFDVVITAGTVDSVSVVGSVVASFTIRKSSALKPTTAGRSLDVSAGGEAGIDWANIGSPTTAVNLSGTNIDVDQVVASVSGAVASVTAAVTVGTMNANTLTASALAADAVTEIQSGLATSSALATVEGKIDTIDATADAILVDTSEIGVAGAGLTALASAADVVTLIGYVDTEVAAIKAKTDLLPAAAAGASGGLMINGANTGAVTFDSGVTISNAGGSALTLTSSGGNGDGLRASGHGTGDGIAATGGATGHGVHAQGGATSGDGVRAEAQGGNGNGLNAIGQGTGLDLAADNLATAAQATAIQTTTDKLDDMLVLSSDGWIFTIAALQDAPSGGSAPSAAEIADAVWDEALAGHATAGSAGAALTAAGSAGDPWATLLPGAYGAGTAGQIIGDNLNATVSSRAAATDLATAIGYIDTEISDIQSRLPAALVGGRMDASVGAMAANVVTASALAADAVAEIQSGLSTLDAAGVRAAVGLASANLDTQLDALPTAAENATAVMASTIEGTFDLTESARLWNAALAGKASGLATATATFRDLADGKDRIVATVDADGNRTAVTRDVT